MCRFWGTFATNAITFDFAVLQIAQNIYVLHTEIFNKDLVPIRKQ